MKRTLTTLLVAIAVSIGVTGPVEAQPASSHCWSRLVESHVEHRFVHWGGRDWAEFRTVATYRRHCSGTGKPVLVTVTTPWGPGRR